MFTDDYAEFFTEFMGESDRAAIVLGAAQMDDLLASIVQQRLIDPRKELFDFNGPFGTFSSRIETAYATGVIDKSFAQKIHLVRKIRNHCAHDIRKVNLDSPPVSNQIADLAKAFSDTEFWATNLRQAGDLYKVTGNSLTLRFSIALLVANLAMINRAVQGIDGSSAQPVFSPQSGT